jgi:hypothetical protein
MATMRLTRLILVAQCLQAALTATFNQYTKQDLVKFR